MLRARAGQSRGGFTSPIISCIMRAMKKTLHLYIFREISAPFLLGLATFTSVLLMGRLLRLADMVVAKGVPLLDILRLVIYLLPFFCLVTIPMAFLLAILLAFSRLSADGEITAMKAGGASIYGMMPPVLLFALFAYAATAFITIKALPWGNTAFRQQVYELAQSRADLALKEKVFIDDFPGMVMYLDRYDDRQRSMTGVLIHDDRNPKEPSTIFAARGKIAADEGGRLLRLNLSDGSIHRSVDTTGYRLVSFQNYDLAVDLSSPGKKVDKDEQDMTFAELRAGIAAQQGTDKQLRDMMLEFHRRFALPFASFVFALVGVPLGIQNQRSGKAAGFSLSIGIIVLYYILLSAGKILGQRGIVDAAVAVWAPNIILALFGLYLLRSTAAERRMKLFTKGADLVQRIRLKFGRSRA